MHEIALNLIKPSPNPVRKTWDEQKMQELAQSIKEQGVIVPIKVRPNGAMANFIAEIPGWYRLYGKETGVPFDFFEQRKIAGLSDRERPGTKSWHMAGFEVVYGHRRIEAARRAGLDEIPAIVEGVEDTDAIWQALIENLSNEDMSAYEKGEEIEKLKRKGFTIREQSKRIGVHEELLRRWREYYNERQSGIEVPTAVGNEKVAHVQTLKQTFKSDIKSKQAVLDKAIEENLNEDDTRAVAYAYRDAPTPELKQAILETSGKLGDSDLILESARRKIGSEKATDRNEQERRKAFEEYEQAVKDFIDAAKLFDRMVRTARNASRYGKFSPEGARYTIGRIDNLINELNELKGVLSNVE